MAISSPTLDSYKTLNASVGASEKTIAGNFTQFLTLLTAQLKNQNPLEPLNTNEFTQQLIQYASIEQQLKSNKTLDSLLSATQNANTTTALGFVGMQISADGVVSSLSKGQAGWGISAPRGGTALISIKNSAGETVFKTTKQLNAGAQSFNWDGKLADGSSAADGQYSLTADAKDSTGQPMTVDIQMSGIVDGVDFFSDGAVLRIGQVSVPIAKVKSMRKPL